MWTHNEVPCGEQQRTEPTADGRRGETILIGGGSRGDRNNAQNREQRRTKKTEKGELLEKNSENLLIVEIISGGD